MTSLDLSIVIPFYKGDIFIASLIHSLKDAYLFMPEEKRLTTEVLIIVDSPETSASDLAKAMEQFQLSGFEIIVKKNERNLGVAESRNQGIVSNGRYIYWIDQDDGVEKNFFNILMPAMEGGYDFILMNGSVTYENDRRHKHLIYYFKPHVNIRNLILDDIVRSPGQVVLKRSVIQNARFLSAEQYRGSDDKFFWILIFLINPKINFKYISTPLYKASIHSDNYSHNRMEMQMCSMELWKIMSDRYDTSAIKKYMRRNLNYLKFIVRSQRPVSLKEHILGFYEALVYFLSLNKIVRYFIKHF